jgi:hypothetical protein
MAWLMLLQRMAIAGAPLMDCEWRSTSAGGHKLAELVFQHVYTPYGCQVPALHSCRRPLHVSSASQTPPVRLLHPAVPLVGGGWVWLVQGSTSGYLQPQQTPQQVRCLQAAAAEDP